MNFYSREIVIIVVMAILTSEKCISIYLYNTIQYTYRNSYFCNMKVRITIFNKNKADSFILKIIGS